MDRATLRALQAPLKDKYRDRSDVALVAARGTARVDASGDSSVDTWSGVARAGLHAALGGDGTLACPADLILQAVASCAAITLSSVATAMGIVLRKADVSAEGTWDARGTLGLSRSVPVGLTSVRLVFDLDTDADDQTKARLIELTERYCVV